jgi:DNA replication protein DnaC
MAALRVAKLWEADNLGAYARMTFESFHNRPHEQLRPPDLSSLSLAKLAAVAFAANPVGFIVFTGPNGCGKTHLAAAIANHVVRTHKVIFLRVIDFLDYLRQAFDPSAGVSFGERFDAAKRVDLLVLDDLGAEHSTPWVNERLFTLLDDRYMYGRPTVITSNVEVGKMQLRVASRLRDTATCQVLAMQAPDMRPVRNKYATLL